MMRPWSCILLALLLFTSAFSALGATLAEQNAQLFRELQDVHSPTATQMERVRTIFARSGFVSQGNPAISVHPMTREACRAQLASQSVQYEDPAFERICRSKYMAPLYDPKSARADEAQACIDQFEFPNIPCAYPVVWVRAREAAQLCEAIGKRLCDAHEWEGACAGRLTAPDYRFDLARGVIAEVAVSRMAAAHNRLHGAEKSWSYGPTYQRGVCATGSEKTAGCAGGGWSKCGSNTYPAGSFPGCRSALGAYDLHGNAAEHMNLPLDASQMASRASTALGVTEMKGSWFTFDAYRAHEDWCRWRAPFWHGSTVMHERSHANYHLGFRCCKAIRVR